MDTPNHALSFSANISAFFLGNDWRTDVMENSVTFWGSNLQFSHLQTLKMYL